MGSQSPTQLSNQTATTPPLASSWSLFCLGYFYRSKGEDSCERVVLRKFSQGKKSVTQK